MKKWIARGLVAFMVLSLACSLPALSGCGKRKPKEDPKARKDFVDTADPSKVQGTMKPIGGPAEGTTSDAGATK